MRRFRVYDSLSRSLRLFVPITPPRVGLYVCGLTPYAPAHIGHGRTAVTFDVVARALRRWGYRVLYVQNVTNLDDHLIARAAELGVDPLRLAETNFADYRSAMDRLGVDSVNVYPFATDFLPEILEQIGTLVDRGFAYPSEGSVYYEVAKFPTYGRLSGQRVEELRSGSRPLVEKGKHAPEDFALWKAAVPGEPTWDSPWGPGRPGWHIEDTAITARLLGAQYDLHGGGLELKFPHHEAEIALAEAATGRSPLVNYWMHAGLLQLRGEKMAKSLGNVVSLSETIDRYGGDPLRLYYLSANYRNPLDFVEGRSLEETREAWERLTGPYRGLAALRAPDDATDSGQEPAASLVAEANALPDRLDAELAEDFNTRETLALLFRWSGTLAPLASTFEKLSASGRRSLEAPYQWAQDVLGLNLGVGVSDRPEELGAVVRAAIAARVRARERRDFAEADRIRKELEAAGIALEDEGSETRWTLRPP